MTSAGRAPWEQTIRDRFQELVPQMILLHERVAKEVGISPVALQALHIISLHGHPISPGELSRRSDLPPSTTTRVLAGLESDGYVRRSGVPGDGRRAEISPTAKARTIGRRFDLYAAAMQQAADGFSDQELATVARYWNALVDNVRDQDHR